MSHVSVWGRRGHGGVMWLSNSPLLSSLHVLQSVHVCLQGLQDAAGSLKEGGGGRGCHGDKQINEPITYWYLSVCLSVNPRTQLPSYGSGEGVDGWGRWNLNVFWSVARVSRRSYGFYSMQISHNICIMYYFYIILLFYYGLISSTFSLLWIN